MALLLPRSENRDEQDASHCSEPADHGPVRVVNERLLDDYLAGESNTSEGVEGNSSDERRDTPRKEYERKGHDNTASLFGTSATRREQSLSTYRENHEPLSANINHSALEICLILEQSNDGRDHA